VRLERALIGLYAAILAAEAVALTYRYATESIDNSDPLSIGLGWAGLASMVVMLIYSFARRSKAMKRFAPLKTWLHFHIFCGVQGVLFVFFHCLPTITAISPAYLMNPGVLAAIAVGTVFSSGLIGRYL
jgi:predicted ferric reductase